MRRLRRYKATATFVLFVVVLLTASTALMSTDWGRSWYCAGKVDALDPWC